MDTLERRVLDLLERFFTLAPTPMDVVLSQSADHICQALGCEKVDVFLRDERTQTLVAVGASHTELGQLQVSLGLHRLPLANADPMARVFQTGEIYHHAHCDQDATQPRGVIEHLGVRSMIAVPFEVGGERRGVLSLAWRAAEAYSEEDLALVRLLAVWIGNLTHRAELMDAVAVQASERTRRAAAEEIITVLAHDLRNLLNPVTIRLALLLERAHEEGRAQDVKDCERSLSGLERINTIMSDLLDVARIDQGMLALSFQTFDLVQLVRDTALTLARPDVEVSVITAKDRLNVTADRNRVAQALDNVLSNAIKHSPRHNIVHIELGTTLHEGRMAAQIAVIDQGPGIAPELMPRIFERYVRGGSAAGLGLGLYLAQATLAAHGGCISMSCAGAQGTRCELILPMTRAPAPDAQS